jgi:hypothetical protein
MNRLAPPSNRPEGRRSGAETPGLAKSAEYETITPAWTRGRKTVATKKIPERKSKPAPQSPPATGKNPVDGDFAHSSREQVDPLDAVRGHSTRLTPVLEAEWPGSGRRYVSANVERVLMLGANFFGRHADNGLAEIDTVAALSASLMLDRKESPWAGGLASILDEAGYKRPLPPENRIELERDPKRAADDLLRWDAVALLAEASKLRQETNLANETIGLRHLWFGALFFREGQRALQQMGLLDRGLGPLVEALAQSVTAERVRGYSDSPDAWSKLIVRARQAPLLIELRKASSGFTPDIVADETGSEESTTDPLGTNADAVALADLILLEAAEPPLAIGLFGSWGSGKSTLMRRMKREIKRHNDEAEAIPPPSAGDDRQTRRVRRVAQLEFNAWSFIDSQNLWASLTSEVFEQLRAGGGDEWAKAQGAWLVGEVGGKTVEQAAAVETARTDVAIKEQALEAAESKLQETRDKLAQAPVEAAGKILTNQAGPMAGRISQGLHELAETGRRIDELGLPGLLRSALDLWRRAAPVKLWITAGLVALSAAALVVMLNLDQLRAMTAPWIALGLASATAIATAARPLFSVVTALIQYRAVVSEKQRTLGEEESQQKLAVDQARVEHEAATAGEATSAETLATLTDTAKDPARLLAYLLTESLDIKAVRGQLGLLGSVRRCFQSLDELIQMQRIRRGDSEGDRPAAEKADSLADQGVPDPADAIDRIVLYVDDLDRCSARQVVQILEAVHLLLAFKCFVVVVAIDPRWLRRSLEIGHSQFDEAQGQRRQADKPSPSDYLEKIFQIPFWVRPMGTDGEASPYVRYLDQLLGPRPATGTDGGSETATETGGHGRTGALIGEPPTEAEEALTSNARVERISLSAAERDLMDRLGPLAAKSPRAIKRLINVYRLIRARLSVAEEIAFLGLVPSGMPRFATVQFALALDAGLPAEAVPEVRRQIAALPDSNWKIVADDPDVLLGTGGIVPTRPLDLAEPVLGALKEPLIAANRLQGFVAALHAVKDACGGTLDRGEIDRAFTLTQRYSLRDV